MTKTLLIDGKFFIYRSLTTMYNLTHNELRTGIYFGFLSSLKSLAKKFKPDKILILWDSGFSFRRKIYPQYKRKNKIIEDKNILFQLDVIKSEYEKIKNTFKYLGFASYLKFGLEADDLFAIYCNQFIKEQKIIASRDNDLYQLISEKNNTVLYDPQEKIIKNQKWFENKYKINPNLWPKFKAICGCKSDNVIGIPGVGEITALKYLQGNENSKIKLNQQLINFNLQLVALPLKTSILKNKNTKLDINRFSEFCFDMGFKSFIKDMNSFKELFYA